MLGAHEKPDVTYADVGGLDMQKQEIREAVELPLTHFDLYKQIGALHQSRNVGLYLTIMCRYRSAAWCPAVWPAWNRKDYARESCSEQYDGELHQGSGLRVCPKVSW